MFRITQITVILWHMCHGHGLPVLEAPWSCNRSLYILENSIESENCYIPTNKLIQIVLEIPLSDLISKFSGSLTLHCCGQMPLNVDKLVPTRCQEVRSSYALETSSLELLEPVQGGVCNLRCPFLSMASTKVEKPLFSSIQRVPVESIKHVHY